MSEIIDKMLLNFFCIKQHQVGDSGIFLKLVHVLVAVAVPSDSSGREIFICRLVATIAFLSRALLFSPIPTHKREEIGQSSPSSSFSFSFSHINYFHFSPQASLPSLTLLGMRCEVNLNEVSIYKKQPPLSKSSALLHVVILHSYACRIYKRVQMVSERPNYESLHSLCIH